MNKLISEQNLQDKVKQLPKEMSPERDLWSGIELAIQSKQQTKHTENTKGKVVPMAWAASVIAAVLLTWLTLAPLNTKTQSPFNLVKSIQQHFEQQKQSMLVSFGQPNLAELPAEMQKQLTQLASARLTIETALLDDPSNSDLLNLLHWTQKQELDLLEQLYSPKWQTI